MSREEQGRALLARLMANVDAYMSDLIDVDTFHARARAIWARIERSGHSARVSRMLREQGEQNGLAGPPIGSGS